jgi:hypothetical protein
MSDKRSSGDAVLPSQGNETMTTQVYSTAATAVRGFKRANADLAQGLSTTEIRARFIQEQDGSFVIVMPTKKAKTQTLKGVPVRRRSVEPDGATHAVRAFFAEFVIENPKATRKDCIAAAVSDGFAYFTARTQYQKFHAGH